MRLAVFSDRCLECQAMKPKLPPKVAAKPGDRPFDWPTIAAPDLPDLTEIWQQTLQWRPNARQRQQFQQLYAAVLAGNQRLNLTRITEPTEFWEKHLWDSLYGIQPYLAAPTQPATFSVIDIGSGAGFPGVPVAIAHPDWQVTLLEATHKKGKFLQYLVTLLGLDLICPVVERAEVLGQAPNARGHYDLALIRAVAPTAVCAEYTLPLLKPGGMAILYRGQLTEAEAKTLEPVVIQLGGTIETVKTGKTPLTGGDRHCLYLRKIGQTPDQFPRAVGIPTHNPLC